MPRVNPEWSWNSSLTLLREVNISKRSVKGWASHSPPVSGWVRGAFCCWWCVYYFKWNCCMIRMFFLLFFFFFNLFLSNKQNLRNLLWKTRSLLNSKFLTILYFIMHCKRQQHLLHRNLIIFVQSSLFSLIHHIHKSNSRTQ